MITHAEAGTVAIPARTCACGLYTTRATGQPKPGDLTACPGCGVFLVFEAALTLRELEHDEIAELPEQHAVALHRIRAEAKARAEARWAAGDYN